MKKLWALKVGGVQIEGKKKTCFANMKVFFNSLGFSSFLVPKQTFRQWELNLWTFSTINANKILIMFVLVSYFQLNLNYIISSIFWLGSTRFQLGFNYVCQLCIR
jgi:hypothetical protein